MSSRRQACRFPALILLLLVALQMPLPGESLKPGQVVQLTFPDAELPPTLYSMMNEKTEPARLQLRLPDDYDLATTFPLLVYVPGFDGGPAGNLENARSIAGDRGWIVASLPLFKKTVDRSEVSGGIIVGFEDEPTIAAAYAEMLGKVFETIPRIDRNKSAMVGFSNGAQTIAVLASCHDAFVFDHFRNFCLVDHGMFHLTDLHKSGARESRYLILAGDQGDMGRDLKIRGGELTRDEWKLLGVDMNFRILKDTGHAFEQPHMDLVGKWLRHESLPE